MNDLDPNRERRAALAARKYERQVYILEHAPNMASHIAASAGTPDGITDHTEIAEYTVNLLSYIYDTVIAEPVKRPKKWPTVVIE